MGRNYKNENKWAEKRYKKIQIKLLPEEHSRLAVVLERQGLKVTAWIRKKLNEDERLLDIP